MGVSAVLSPATQQLFLPTYCFMMNTACLLLILALCIEGIFGGTVKPKNCDEDPEQELCQDRRKRSAGDDDYCTNDCDEEGGFCRKKRSLPDEVEVEVRTFDEGNAVVLSYFTCGKIVSEAGIKGYQCYILDIQEASPSWFVTCKPEKTEPLVQHCVRTDESAVAPPESLCRQKLAGWFCVAKYPSRRRRSAGDDVKDSDFADAMEAAKNAQEKLKKCLKEAKNMKERKQCRDDARKPRCG